MSTGQDVSRGRGPVKIADNPGPKEQEVHEWNLETKRNMLNGAKPDVSGVRKMKMTNNEKFLINLEKMLNFIARGADSG